MSIATATTDEEMDAVWGRLGVVRLHQPEAFDSAIRLLRGQFWDRRLGCFVLAVLCNPDEGGWSHAAAKLVTDLADAEEDHEVILAITEVLRMARDPIGIPVLTRLKDSSDRDVRLGVAMALPSCRTFDRGEDLTSISKVLVELTKDEDAEVREFATFGIGTLLENVEGQDISDALVSRITDDDLGTRWEAILGLARRGDESVFGVIDSALRQEPTHPKAVEAAAALGDVRLYPLLLSVNPWWPSARDDLALALGRCDPSSHGR